MHVYRALHLLSADLLTSHVWRNGPECMPIVTMSASRLAYPEFSLFSAALGYFTVGPWDQSFAQRNPYVYSQASRSNYRRYFHVLKFLLLLFSVVPVLKQKGVMQTIRLAEV